MLQTELGSASGSCRARGAPVTNLGSFFARCGIPQLFPSSLLRADKSTGVPHVRTSVRGPKTMGKAHQGLSFHSTLEMFKERRRKLWEPTKLHRNSSVWGTRSW
jgi:hypothetical protein